MQTDAESDAIFQDAENAMNRFFDTVDHNHYKASKEEINAGVRLFRRFLNYCDDLGVIDGYYEERVSSIFREYVETAEREKNSVKLKLIQGGGHRDNRESRTYE
jgi:hypothetical protein